MLLSDLFHELYESRQLQPVYKTEYEKLVDEYCYVITINFQQLNKWAKDSNSQHELDLMMQHFRKPVINGRTIFDLSKDQPFLKNPKVVPHVLKYIYDMLKYIEPRLKMYLNPKGLSMLMPVLEKLKNEYRAYVTKVS